MLNSTSQQEPQATRPIDLVLSRIRTRSYSRGHHAHCPAHHDSNNSLMIWEDESDGHVGLKCFAGCSRTAICESLGIAETDLYIPSGGRTYRPKKHYRKLDLIDLAEHKLIPPNFLLLLGLEDGYTWHTPKGKTIKNVVRIPYYTPDGKEYTRARIRTSLAAKDGSFWEGPNTDALIPYGLNRLEQACSAGYLLIVEGESDCWTCWLHQVPVLGLPSATTTSCLTDDLLSLLEGVEKIYISQEPDQAGKDFPSRVTQQLRTIGYAGQCYAMPLLTTHEAKDPNALHQRLYAEGRVKAFKEELQRTFDTATLVKTTKPEQDETSPSFEEVQAHVFDAIEKQEVNTLYNLAEKIAALDTKSQETLKSSIKSGMQKTPGWSWMGCKKLIDEAQKKQQRAAREEHIKVSNKPEIILGRQLSEETDDILNALYKANHPPQFFVRNGHLVAVRTDEKQRSSIEILDEHSMLARIARVADFLSYNEKADTYKNTHPTRLHARQVLAQEDWKFPPLEAVIEVPMLRPDGTVLDVPGYDPETCLFYIPQHGLQVPPIPNNPTQDDAKRAVAFILDFIDEFPYAAEADKANTLGMLLTPVIRHLVRVVPLALLNGTKMGTGKGLLTDVISHIALGREAESINEIHDNEEWSKMLLSLLIKGSTFISIDNIDQTLQSGVLAKVLTSGSHQGRILGKSETIIVEQHATWVANGNNIQVGRDMVRRCYQIRLDAKTSTPYLRNNFKRPNEVLLRDVRQQRGTIVAALLTMVRAWYVDGQPKPEQKLPTVGATFSDWSHFLGCILHYAGITGFLGNLDKMREEADTDGNAWTLFLETWLQHVGAEAHTVANIAEAISKSEDFTAALPDRLATLYDEREKIFKSKKKLGKAFEKMRDVRYGPKNLYIMRGPDTRTKVATWQVAIGNAGSDEKSAGSDAETFPPAEPQQDGSTGSLSYNKETAKKDDLQGMQGVEVNPDNCKITFFSSQDTSEKEKKSKNVNSSRSTDSLHSLHCDDGYVSQNGSTGGSKMPVGSDASAGSQDTLPAHDTHCSKHHKLGIHVDSTGHAWCDHIECWDCYRLMMYGEAIQWQAFMQSETLVGIALGRDGWKAFVDLADALSIDRALKQCKGMIARLGMNEEALADTLVDKREAALRKAKVHV